MREAPRVRRFGGLARYQDNEAIWFAQLVTWWPLVSQLVGLIALLYFLVDGSAATRLRPPSSAWSPLVMLLFLILYGLAGFWIGERQRRGIWLAIVLFGWSIIRLVLGNHLLTFSGLYDVLALILVIRAGRVIGARYLTAAPRRAA